MKKKSKAKFQIKKMKRKLGKYNHSEINEIIKKGINPIFFFYSELYPFLCDYLFI